MLNCKYAKCDTLLIRSNRKNGQSLPRAQRHPTHSRTTLIIAVVVFASGFVSFVIGFILQELAGWAKIVIFLYLLWIVLSIASFLWLAYRVSNARCVHCGSSCKESSRRVFQDGHNIIIYRCQNCGMRWLAPVLYVIRPTGIFSVVEDIFMWFRKNK